MMIVFNRATESTLVGGWIIFDRSKPTHVNMRLNHMAEIMLGLTAKSRVCFIKVGDDWFIAKDDTKDGYPLSTAGTGGLRINSKKFVIAFLDNVGTNRLKFRCKIKKTASEYRSNPMFQIILTHIQ